MDFDEELLLRVCREGPRRGERGLTGDIKLIWDYSRGQPLVTNAAASPGTLDASVSFLTRWLHANSDTSGPAWICAMDVAIRAVNWIVADLLYSGELGRRMGKEEWAGWLWRHGWIIWRGLEAKLVGSNHYLADLVGLLFIGSLFPHDRLAQGWRAFAINEFPRALLAQSWPDGGLKEASLRYHAYVTEMALLFRLAQGQPFPAAAEKRLAQMCQIVADFSNASGDVFAFGDDDSGRVLALDFASPLGRAQVLLRLAEVLGQQFKSSPEGFRPDTGWWVRRADDFVLAAEFGGVGLEGLGAHAHNDDLSFCVDWRGKTVLADPGTFLYTSDIEARNRFRSTRAHSTVIIDDREQRVLTLEPFGLPGPMQAYPAEPVGEEGWAFTRPLGQGMTHRRELRLKGARISLRDTLAGSGRHRAQWRFQLHPHVAAHALPNGFALELPGTGSLKLETSNTSLQFEIETSEYSPGYGRTQQSHTCVAGIENNLPLTVDWQIQPGQ